MMKASEYFNSIGYTTEEVDGVVMFYDCEDTDSLADVVKQRGVHFSHFRLPTDHHHSQRLLRQQFFQPYPNPLCLVVGRHHLMHLLREQR